MKSQSYTWGLNVINPTFVVILLHNVGGITSFEFKCKNRSMSNSVRKCTWAQLEINQVKYNFIIPK